MMAKTIVIRAPWIFTAIWRVVRKFLDAKVLDKIDICGSNNFLPVLEKHIDREWIPQYDKDSLYIQCSEIYVSHSTTQSHFNIQCSEICVHTVK